MDLDTLLRETAAVPDATPVALARGRAALDAATVAERRVRAAGLLRSRRARRYAVTALVAAAASLALVVGPTVDLGRGPSASAAAEVLRRAGAAAGAQPGGWADAAYWHSVSSYSRNGGPAVRREIWIGHHDIGVLRDQGVQPGEVLPLEVASFPDGGGGVTWDELYALPTEPSALERTLRAGITAHDGKAFDQDGWLFVAVGDLLRESPASPELRKALWEVAARIPGVTLAGATTDGAGRAGVAVERDGQRYVLDPDDGRLLEESAGAAWRTTYLDQGPADSAPAPTSVEQSKG